MEIRTFDPRLDAETAVARADRITIGTFLRARAAALLGISEEPLDVSIVYYPDYIAFTTVELYHYLTSDRTQKFLVGIDAVTGRVGEIDIELPSRNTVEADPDKVIARELTPDEAREEWKDWLFSYVDRRFRPFKRPDFSLDELELIYVPYWVVDYGTVANSFAVSGLTKQVEELVSLKPIKGYYEEVYQEKY
ncbi:hypothetical protein [Halegenticoccus soli]|uniref:hypothetical protein n=1 Tax=Halegenticoccus soli TaxID=1985678 RepID=UPI000C6CAE87|nr:hypothetical protein [Halegenticoccus soli]